MRTGTGSRFVIGLTMAATGMIAGGMVASGAAPDPGGVIRGCLARSGGLPLLSTPPGSLRVLDASAPSCNGNETAIQWNQSGPPGVAGPQGPQGPAGPQGPPGGGRITYVAESKPVAIGINGAGADVLSLPLPAGRHVLTGRAHVFNVDQAARPTLCRLSTGGESEVTVPGNSFGYVMVLEVQTLANPSTVTMHCATMQGAVLGAVLVAD